MEELSEAPSHKRVSKIAPETKTEPKKWGQKF
jgi:hypothetical protein